MENDALPSADDEERTGRPYWRDGRSALWLVALVAIVGARIGWSSVGERVSEALAEGDFEMARVADGQILSWTDGARVLWAAEAASALSSAAPSNPASEAVAQLSEDLVAPAGGRLRLTFPLTRADEARRFVAFARNGEALLNDELLRTGAAKAAFNKVDTSTMKRRPAAAQREARWEEREIWSKRTAAPLAADRTDEGASRTDEEPNGTDGEGA
jgi:hypothetical protein